MFLVAIILVWYRCYEYEGLVTYYKDGVYILSEFWYNKYTNNYKLEILCKCSEQVFLIINRDDDIVPLHDKIEEINSRGI